MHNAIFNVINKLGWTEYELRIIKTQSTVYKRLKQYNDRKLCRKKRQHQLFTNGSRKLDMLADYGFVYRYWARYNTMQVHPAFDGEDCRRVYVVHFWLYYILFIVITIIFSHYFLYSDYWNNGPCQCIGTERGAGIILANIGCQYHLNNCEIWK